MIFVNFSFPSCLNYRFICLPLCDQKYFFSSGILCSDRKINSHALSLFQTFSLKNIRSPINFFAPFGSDVLPYYLEKAYILGSLVLLFYILGSTIQQTSSETWDTGMLPKLHVAKRNHIVDMCNHFCTSSPTAHVCNGLAVELV